MVPRAVARRCGLLGIALAGVASATCSTHSKQPAPRRRWLALCWIASLCLGVGCHLGLELGLKAAGFDSRRLFLEGRAYSYECSCCRNTFHQQARNPLLADMPASDTL